ncbi:MAG TPA: LysE family transporter [Burkholderiaceae bacterium]|nr:LysE family transporter [Burkholderiaceae bacterium]
MELPLFLKAMLLGLAIAAPVGPIGLLCIQRTLAHGLRIGIATGLGAALADACYGAAAALGFAVAIAAIGDSPLWQVAAALLLIGLAAVALRAPAPRATRAPDAPPRWLGPWTATASTFALTIANPMTVLSFVAMFGVLGVTRSDPDVVLAVICGVFAGSMIWWLILSGTVTALRAAISPRASRAIQFGSALVLLAFGLYALVVAASVGARDGVGRTDRAAHVGRSTTVAHGRAPHPPRPLDHAPVARSAGVARADADDLLLERDPNA